MAALNNLGVQEAVTTGCELLTNLDCLQVPPKWTFCNIPFGWTIRLPHSRVAGLIRVGAIGAFMNIVHQPRKLLVRGLNAGMGTAAGADELVEIPTDAHRPTVIISSE